jgi:membrane associated rhomboid family serine protease
VRLKVLEAPAEVAGRPWATQTLLVLILVAYAVTLAQGVLGSAIEYIRYGANAQVLIAQGQVWRLIASSFLHAASPLHVGLNAVGLWSMGVMAERLFGRSTFLAIYFGSAIGGALGSAAMQTGGFSVGASTALFGLFGALLYAQLVRFRGKVPVRYRVSDSAWFTMIALNMSLTILFPMIDWAAHVVGAVTGVLIAVLLISDEERLPIAHPSRIARVSGVLLTLAAVVSVGFAVRNIVLWDPMGDTAVLKSLVLWDRAPPVLLNDLAFTIATQPSPPPEHLELADRAARRAVDADPSPMVVDTQATVAFRRGDLERAIELEAEVVNDPESEKLVRPGKKVNEVPFLATQLLRFIVARQARSGTLVGKDAPSGLSVRVENSRLAIRTETRIEKPIAVYVVAKEGDKPLGLAIVPIMPTPAFVEPPVINTSALDLPWADTASVTIGYIAKGNVKARIFEADPEALALPGP